MIKASDDKKKHPDYIHICNPGWRIATNVSAVIDMYNHFYRLYTGWFVKSLSGPEETTPPHIIYINFCPFCGEKLPSHQPQEPENEEN